MLIERLCERICAASNSTAADRDAAFRAFEDTVAVALAGWFEPVTRAALGYAAGTRSPLIDGSTAASAEHAAFVHSVAGHALDFDDVHLVSITHPSVVIVPALIAAASERTCIRSMLDAYGVGISVNIALGHALGFEHYSRGWHATSTIGPIAAAAAICHLLGHDQATVRNAIALSAAQSAGMQRNFGSMAKPMQAGFAAMAGVRAALLASQGVSGNSDIFGEKGFLDLYGADGFDPPALGPGDVHSISVKLYPCCYAAQRLIDAAFQAREELGSPLDGEEIERVELKIPFETMRPLRILDPSSGSEAQFCASYILAAALLQGQLGLADFTDEAIDRREVRSLMERIRIEDDAASGREAVGLEHGRVDVRVHCATRRAEGSSAAFPGSPQSPPTKGDMEAKISNCAGVYSANAGREFTRADVQRLVLNLTGETLAAG